PTSRPGESLVDPQRSCRVNRTGAPGESAATLKLCPPGDRRGAGDVHNGLPISAPLVAQPASPAQTEVAIGCFCCRKVSDSDLFSAADPRARHAETAASAKMRKLRHCTHSGIAQTTGDCGPMREPAPSSRYLAQRRAPSASLHDVVRGLDGHLDVVRVAFLQPR